MKKVLFGIIAGVLVATAVGAYQAEERKSDSPMGGMMQGMKGMMGDQKPGEQSQDMMQGMKEMMGRMSKMMDMCSQMMGSQGNRLDQQPSEKK
jgi:hypothetical protein